MSSPRTVTLSIAEQFSRYPVGRFHADSDYNGTRFREEFLVPELRNLSKPECLEVSFDGLEGAGSSFLEPASRRQLSVATATAASTTVAATAAIATTAAARTAAALPRCAERR